LKKVGILQLNPHTFWKRGGGEVQASKYVEFLHLFGYDAEWFNFKEPTQYDIIHFFGANIQLSEWGQYAAKQGIKVVGTPILFPTKNTFKYKAFLAFDQFLPFPTSLRYRKNLLEDAHRLIANTQVEKDYLSEAYGIDENKITVISTGVNSSFFETITSKSDLPEAMSNWDHYFLMVGRVTPLKAQLKVLEILKNTNLKMVICGPPDQYETQYLQSIRNLIAQHPNRFIWIEGLPADSRILKALYRYSAAHVLFSDSDVAPLVNMEASALGTLVVSKAHITVYEILGDLAIYVDKQNLVTQLDSVLKLTTTERETRIKALQKLVKENMTWEKIVEKSAKLYDQM
jgi:glycosyltransferase involved in cell wall biosynthesis